ncbi:MAG: uroporphyrinogen decarboxylase family protein [Candidatus Promineifilaceae bacterium]
MPQMSSRERLLTAINHEEADRVPFIIGAGNATGIQMPAYQRLKTALNIEAPDRYLYDWPELGTADLDEATLIRLGSDVRGLFDSHPAANIERNRARPPGAPFFDSWGIGQIEIEPGVWFPGIHPLAKATTTADLDAYPGWPDMDDPSRFAHMKAQAARLAAENQYAIMATPWLLFPFERAMQMQGMEPFFINLATNPDFAAELLARCAHYCKILMGHILEELGDNVDIVKIGDDLGTSASLLISPRMYRRLLKPIHADYIAFIKERTRAKLFFHSDGDIFPLIDDLIEIGVDILNPIQTSAGKMSDLATLKKRFGKNIVLCGAVDTTHVLPFGTPAQVRQEVRQVIEQLAPGGGYILAAVHTIQKNVPPENILAMVDALDEYGWYGGD